MSVLIIKNKTSDTSLNNEIKSHLSDIKVKKILKNLRDLTQSDILNEKAIKVKILKEEKPIKNDNYISVKTFKDYFEDFVKEQQSLEDSEDSESDSSEDEEKIDFSKYKLVISDCGSDSDSDSSSSSSYDKL